MAFLDNPAIILAHIRQSHVTSDDTGMCEMVLIDQDVDLEKCQLALVPGSSCGSTMSGSLNDGGDSVTDNHACDLSQSMDITSSWDFGIRRRSNTAQRLERLRKERQNQIKCKNIQWKERTSSQSVEDLGSLFEKRDFKDRQRTTGTKSTLSLRLEQCPQQLNNPFNEYSKFDGKGHIGTTATKKIDVYLSMQIGQEKVHPMTVVTIANARVHDLIGLICWQYTSEGREPKLNENVNAYCLHIAEDDGEVDTDFPPLDSNEPIHKFGFSTLALVEKYSSPGLASRQSLFGSQCQTQTHKRVFFFHWCIQHLPGWKWHCVRDILIGHHQSTTHPCECIVVKNNAHINSNCFQHAKLINNQIGSSYSDFPVWIILSLLKDFKGNNAFVKLKMTIFQKYLTKNPGTNSALKSTTIWHFNKYIHTQYMYYLRLWITLIVHLKNLKHLS
uniref:Uncharacterized protein n=1 Tax=Mola mola TaxID=94237 RepID=A0A3Q3WSU2_MOLML